MEKILEFLWIVGLAIIIIAAIAFTILRFYLIGKYGDKPITEVPYWVVWITSEGGQRP